MPRQIPNTEYNEERYWMYIQDNLWNFIEDNLWNKIEWLWIRQINTIQSSWDKWSRANTTSYSNRNIIQTNWN